MCPLICGSSVSACVFSTVRAIILPHLWCIPNIGTLSMKLLPCEFFTFLSRCLFEFIPPTNVSSISTLSDRNPPFLKDTDVLIRCSILHAVFCVIPISLEAGTRICRACGLQGAWWHRTICPSTVSCLQGMSLSTHWNTFQYSCIGTCVFCICRPLIPGQREKRPYLPPQNPFKIHYAAVLIRESLHEI